MSILVGDSLEMLRSLPASSVNCAVTSPPYYGLRDYGVSGQIGLEETPDAFVAKLVEVFREVRRVLKDDGTLWLNLGDSYFAKPPGNPGAMQRSNGTTRARGEDSTIDRRLSAQRGIPPGCKAKDLIGIPWRVAFALQADGWYLRQDIIWHKPNPMPESVRDRCTKAHEYIFLLSKSRKYYFDSEAIKEPMKLSSVKRQETGWNGDRKRGMPTTLSPHSMSHYGKPSGGMRNKRSVWTVTTKPFKGAHFATFPPDLVEPCILAGCPVGGTVLDPFFGAGTTGFVAQKLNRKYIGIELNAEYAEIAKRRCGG